MNQCPISYAEIAPGVRYSQQGLKRLSNRPKDLRDLPYSAEEQWQEAIARASKMSLVNRCFGHKRPRLMIGTGLCKP